MLAPWSNRFIKIPFKDRGRTRDGADCWGLTRIIYGERLGIVLPMLDHYKHVNDRDKMAEIIKEESIQWETIQRGQEREYDIVVFNMVGQPMHVGIVIRPNYMIHCLKGVGTAIESYSDAKWCNRIERIYRYPQGAGGIDAVPSGSQN